MGFRSFRNPYNTTFKQHVVAALYHDIYIFPETHCLKNDTVEFDSYIVYHNNRVPHTNVTKGSGGIAIAIHSTVLEYHTILGVYNGVDGQLAVKMQCNKSETKIGVLGLYLSPDSYRYGQDSEGFFDQASVLWEELSDCDLKIGGGDINARTRDMVDYIPEIDGGFIPKRNNPDKNKNAHADSFITFLKDNRAIILNGRITPEYDNYTFVSTRGCSVPDYFFCPVENMHNCTEMKTNLVSDIINELGLPPPDSIPDHSILSGKFLVSDYEIVKNFEQQSSQSTVIFNDITRQEQPVKLTKKNLTKINDSFMTSQETLQLILATISKLQTEINTKEEINRLWAEVKNIFTLEMNNLLDIPRPNCKKQNRKFRKGKPFWNQELEQLWTNACKSEKAYLNFKIKNNSDFPIKNMLRLQFKSMQKHFDKKYRYNKRMYHKNEFTNLESNAKHNPTAMWEALRKLNNPPKMKAALEIIREDGSISTDIKEVLIRWYDDISSLFSGLHEDPELAFNEDFYREVLNKLQI